MSLPTYCHCLMNKLTWISRYWVGNLIIRSFSFEIVLKRKIDFTRGSEAELNCPIALSESGKTQRRRIAAAPSSQIISREVLKSEKNTFECWIRFKRHFSFSKKSDLGVVKSFQTTHPKGPLNLHLTPTSCFLLFFGSFFKCAIVELFYFCVIFTVIFSGPTPASFLFIFGLFKQTIPFFQQINVKNVMFI